MKIQERIQRYRKAYPEDNRSDGEIKDELNHDKKIKFFIDNHIKRSSI
ncbi:MAG: hypothetical protein GY853_15375 [PVC group bacterium]|nr:hypothetical protein [PVC group bacterium]